MSECGSRVRTGSEIFDDSSFHESVFGNLSEASDLRPTTPSGAGALDAASPVVHGIVNELPGHNGQLIFVFDVRGSDCMFVPAQFCRTTIINKIDALNIKQIVAEKYKVSQDCVFTGDKSVNNIAVIADLELQKTHMFLLFNTHISVIFGEYSGMRCASIRKDMTVSEFFDVLPNKTETDVPKQLYLFLQGLMVKNSTQRFNSLGLSPIVESKIINQFPLKVKCHYHSTPDVEIVYHLNCFNTDSVGELKSKFCKQFGKQFPSVLNKMDELWFSCSSGILKDVDYFLVDDERITELGLLVTRLEDITIQVSNSDSIPVIVHYTDAGKRIITKVVVTKKNASLEDLRFNIGKHFSQEPNSLKLKLNKTKISESMLHASPGVLKPNARIFVESSSKTTFKIELFSDGKMESLIGVEMYKNDKVSQLKDLLASSGNIDAFLLKLMYSGVEMDDDKCLKEYRIGSDDAIAMVICVHRIKLTIRCPGYPSHGIVIDDSLESTVKDVKMFLSGIIKMQISGMNLILDGKSLNNTSTLTEAGIKSSDTLVATRLSECERKYQSGIFLVYFCDESGVALLVRQALLHCGVLLYIEGSEERDTTSDHSQKPEQAEILSKGIRLLNVKQNEGMYAEEGINNRQRLQIPGLHHDSSIMVNYSAMPETTVQKVTEYTSEIETTVTSLTPNICSQDAIQQRCDACAVRERSKVTTVVVTTGSTSINNPCISSTAAAVQSTYKKEILRNPDGSIIRAEVYSKHTTLTKEELAASTSEEDFSTRQFSLSPKSTTSCIAHDSLQNISISSKSEDDLDRILQFISHLLGIDWPKLAMSLGFKMTEIESCQYRHPNNLSMQAYAMLSGWKTKKGKFATKEALILALRNCDINQMADKLEEIHDV